MSRLGRKMKIYERFTGDELTIAEKIQRRRYQLLINSCIYYHLNQNIISDAQWDKWAKELKTLQDQYPEIAKQVTLYEFFKNWDGSTGAFLPITMPWVVSKARYVLSLSSMQVVEKPKVHKEKVKRRLF